MKCCRPLSSSHLPPTSSSLVFLFIHSNLYINRKVFFSLYMFCRTKPMFTDDSHFTIYMKIMHGKKRVEFIYESAIECENYRNEHSSAVSCERGINFIHKQVTTTKKLLHIILLRFFLYIYIYIYICV
jgi:hypothetical protein